MSSVWTTASASVVVEIRSASFVGGKGAETASLGDSVILFLCAGVVSPWIRGFLIFEEDSLSACVILSSVALSSNFGISS